MRTGRPKRPLALATKERQKLKMMSARPTTAQCLALRAKVVLLCADGGAERDVAKYLHINEKTVAKRRERLRVRRLDGLCDEPRPGAPRPLPDNKVEAVVLSKRPRWHLHFTPTGASWPNLVERFLSETTSRRIRRRGTFASVCALEEALREHLEVHTHDPKSFIWTATADAILAKACRLCGRTCHSGH